MSERAARVSCSIPPDHVRLYARPSCVGTLALAVDACALKGVVVVVVVAVVSSGQYTADLGVTSSVKQPAAFSFPRSVPSPIGRAGTPGPGHYSAKHSVRACMEGVWDLGVFGRVSGGLACHPG